MARGIVQISIGNDGADYILSIEDEDGETDEFSLSYEQLDLLSEAVEEHLNGDADDALLAEDQDGVDEAS
jgi:hypothetical protein